MSGKWGSHGVLTRLSPELQHQESEVLLHAPAGTVAYQPGKELPAPVPVCTRTTRALHPEVQAVPMRPCLRSAHWGLGCRVYFFVVFRGLKPPSWKGCQCIVLL